MIVTTDWLDPSVRWTDKLTLCANGDIIESFTGKVIGHSSPEVYQQCVNEMKKSVSFSINYKESELDE